MITHVIAVLSLKRQNKYCFFLQGVQEKLQRKWIYLCFYCNWVQICYEPAWATLRKAVKAVIMQEWCQRNNPSCSKWLFSHVSQTTLEKSLQNLNTCTVFSPLDQIILCLQNAFDIVHKNIYHATAVLVSVNTERIQEALELHLISGIRFLRSNLSKCSPQRRCDACFQMLNPDWLEKT